MPRATSLSLPLGAQLVGQQWGEAGLPLAHHLVRELKPPFQKHFGELTEAQLIAYAPEDDQEDDIARKFEMVERGPSALIEGPLTVPSTESPIAKLRLFTSFDRRGGRAVRARHRAFLSWADFSPKHTRETELC
jgi:hypothetical protein